MPDLSWLTARPVAHRGLHDAAAGIIENTASAVTAAIAAGYAIEVDLQITADGDAMVHHDDALGRLTEGAGRLADMTAAELRRVPFRLTADRMMTLGELIDLVAGRVTLLVELKTLRDGNPRLPARVAEMLRGYTGPVAAMSFDPAQILALRAMAPKLVRGIVAERLRTPAELLAAWRPGPHFIAYAVRNLPAPAPLLGRYLLRMPLLTWTVRTEADRARARRWADQMIFEGFRA
jgi:glycerophosphoryl diester phosphodiesterase